MPLVSSFNPKIESSWKSALEDEFQKPYFSELAKFVVGEIESGQVVFPPASLIFNAFEKTPFDQVKVVILGQDPYHGDGQAHGLCFSVQKGVALPPSLKNIYKELFSDLGITPPSHGNLESWAEQGVLLLNAVLTVRRDSPASHANRGWEQFTDRVIEELSKQKSGVVFLLWGKYAQEKGKVIDTTKHHVLKAPHPSPFSAHSGFLGCKHFSKVNALLEKDGQKNIHWQIT
ncbi:MAG: uracil-DNA glycosylase [bacterium]